MVLQLEVSASQGNIQKYQSLLTREWTRRSLEEVLGLLWEEVEHSARAQQLPFAVVLNPESAAARREFNPTLVNQIRTFSGFFEHDIVPVMPSAQLLADTRKTKTTAQAETAWAYLTLHTLVRLRGATGFFLDTQSLLFLVSVHHLLPTLKERAYLPEHDCLVNALHMHVMTAWLEQPEHFFYLLGVLMDYLGENDEKEAALRASLQLTPVDDESYLTKVQEYWFALSDAGKPEAAWSFLLSVYRNAPASYLEELEAMMAQVRQYLPSSGGKGTRRHDKV
jgi:hypothetical protein